MPSKKKTEEDPVHILALETATGVSSVALFDKERLVGFYEFHADKLHAKLITVMIERLLFDYGIGAKQLSAVCVAAGPGSYTGLRVGVSVAKGIAMACEIPLLSVNSLEVLAWSVAELAAETGASIRPLIDARRMEVFTAKYDQSVREIMPVSALVVDENTFRKELDEGKVVFLGDGALKCREILKKYSGSIVLTESLSTASSMGKAAWKKYSGNESENIVTFEPFYLKDFVTTKSKKSLL